MFHQLVESLLVLIDTLGYLGVFLLMTIESSFIPFPSELVVPPAAYLAFQGKMSIVLVILAGLGGSLVGALINYFLALYLGRPTVNRLLEMSFTRLLLLDKKKLDKAEKYFVKHGAISTFLGRLIPGIRQLISLPAGFSRMNLASFSFFTSLGAGIWVCVLAFLGYYFGANEELFSEFYKEITFGALGFVAFVGAGYALYIRRK
jgi:membrane protein DedA with SNARE-associated domain